MSKSQREDLRPFFPNNKTMDYVCCWYKKAAEIIKNTKIKCAFVSTNSICQGEQVALLWKDLFNDYNIHIDFAYQTFKWNSESTQKAAVHCVIVGFSSTSEQTDSVAEPVKAKRIYINEKQSIEAKNINGYLLDAPDIFIESRSKPLCKVKEIRKGNQPTEGGNLIIEAEDYEDFIKCEPNARKYIKRLIGAKEYINNLPRYCLWLVGVSPSEIRKMPLVMQRVEKVKKMRLSSTDIATRRLADTPTVFRETNNPDTFVIIPSVSSENRRYVPIGFLDKNTIPTNLVLIIPDATLYDFGVLTSSVHMAWMRAVCGRLEMRYRYSKDIVYNNFPWCAPSDEQKAKIEQTAQEILDARAKYPDCSLADLYDELTMPPVLRKAHQANDLAVMAAYGFSPKMMEREVVAELFKMYERLVANL